MRAGDAAGLAVTMWRTFGARGTWQRARFLARKSLGRLITEPAAVPAGALHAPIPARWPFRLEAQRVRAATDREAALALGEAVAAGAHHAYRAEWRALPRCPAEWQQHPLTGSPYDPAQPWFRLPWYRPEAGDIKDVFEPARFGWTYDLVRAWMITGDDRYPARFWSAVDDFLTSSVPYRGIQWACGQEIAIRSIAWLYAETAFAGAPSTTPERLQSLRRALVWSAERIADAIGYAVSQRNNHALSEATGLIALGARFAGVHPRANRWMRHGRRLLEQLIPDQFAEDGWYIQHSFTYARVALDQLVVAERVLRASGQGLSDGARGRIRTGVELLAELVDDDGDLPNHGANDGALVHPISTRPYRDFRPSITAAATTFGVALPEDVRADGEALAWLGAPPPVTSPRRAVPRARTGPSGWAHAVVRGARVFARAAMLSSRPGHIDPLHTDVWLDGRRVAIDAGTFRYHAPAPWGNALTGLEVHNSVSLPDLPAGRRVGRFLWGAWPEARVLGTAIEPDGSARLSLEHRSWRREGIRHRRHIALRDGAVTVRDEITAPRGRRVHAVLHWLLEDGSADPRIEASTPALRRETIHGSDGSVLGWVSDHYATRRPVRSLLAHGEVTDGRLAITSTFERSVRDDHVRSSAAAQVTAPGSDDASADTGMVALAPDRGEVR